MKSVRVTLFLVGSWTLGGCPGEPMGHAPSSSTGTSAATVQTESMLTDGGGSAPGTVGKMSTGASSTSGGTSTSTSDPVSSSTGMDPGSTGTSTGETGGTTGGSTTEGGWGCEGFTEVYFGEVSLETPEDKVVLFGVECIGGTVWASDGVGDFLGLESLVRIEGSLDLTGLTYPGPIVSMQGLENLTYVGNLRVWFSAISSLTGLEALEEIHGTLEMHANPFLHDLTGLSSLHTITGAMHLGDWLDDYGFPGLQDLGSLQALRTIGLDLEIYDTSLTDLDELSGLESVGWHASIWLNKSGSPDVVVDGQIG